MFRQICAAATSPAREPPGGTPARSGFFNGYGAFALWTKSLDLPFCFLLEEKCVMQPLLECMEVGVEDRLEIGGIESGLEVGLEIELEVSANVSRRRNPASAGAQCTSRYPADPAQDRMLEAIQTRVEKMAAYFGRRCGVDEDDLRQEAWLAVLEMLPRLDHSVGTPEQHLLKRARWRILDTIRRQRRGNISRSTMCLRPWHVTWTRAMALIWARCSPA